MRSSVVNPVTHFTQPPVDVSSAGVGLTSSPNPGQTGGSSNRPTTISERVGSIPKGRKSGAAKSGQEHENEMLRSRATRQSVRASS